MEVREWFLALWRSWKVLLVAVAELEASVLARTMSIFPRCSVMLVMLFKPRCVMFGIIRSEEERSTCKYTLIVRALGSGFSLIT